MAGSAASDLRANPAELRCPLCADPPEGKLELADGALVCARCATAHPVWRGIPILLSAEDRESSLARAHELGEDAPPPIELGSLEDRPLDSAARLRLYRRIAREGGRALGSKLGWRRGHKRQPEVKSKYERAKYNYYRMNEREIPLLLGGALRLANGWRYKRELVRVIHDTARELRARRLVEVGCGDGTNLWALDRFHPGHGLQLLGFDYSLYRTAIAAHHLGPEHQLWNGDAKRVALPSRCADLALTVHCLEHMRYDNARALRELARLATYVLLLEPFLEHQSLAGRWHNSASDYARDVRANALAAGLELLELRPLKLGSPLNQTSMLLARARAS